MADRVKQDLTAAMKAGEKSRVSALRLVLSELQKAAKEGDGDELAVLRRERKRRHESATAFRGGGRPELAEAEEAEAEVIEAYLPAELSDDELRAIVAEAVAETGRELAQGHGPGHEGVDGARRRPRRRQARVGAGAGGAARLMRRQLELSNEVAAALSGSNDQILRALEGHVDCELFLRGNVITLDGEAEAVAAAAVVVRELSDLIEQGHEIAEGTIAAVTDALDQHESPAEVLEDVVWRHRSTQRRAQDGQPEALRRLDPAQHDHLRHRPGRHRQDLPGRGHGRRGAAAAARSTGSSSPARRSRPASGWASCPAT